MHRKLSGDSADISNQSRFSDSGLPAFLPGAPCERCRPLNPAGWTAGPLSLPTLFLPFQPPLCVVEGSHLHQSLKASLALMRPALLSLRAAKCRCKIRHKLLLTQAFSQTADEGLLKDVEQHINSNILSAAKGSLLRLALVE